MPSALGLEPNREREMDLRSFAIGCCAGVAIWMGTLLGLSYVAGIKWQPVKVGSAHVASKGA